MARSWYAYNGVGDPLLPASYNIAYIKPNCVNGGGICAIYANGVGLNPISLSTNMRNYIAQVQLSLVARPDFSTGVKKYVYGKACC